MQRQFDEFVAKFIPSIKDYVVNVTEFGSSKGEAHPELSDIDIFIIAKKREYIPIIFAIARRLEAQTLRTKHKKLTDFLQMNFFLSNDFTGLHLLALSKDEIDRNFNPKSLRIKLLTLLISRTGLLFNIKHKHRVLYGPDFSAHIKLPKLTVLDRIAAFAFPILLLLVLPLTIKRGLDFKIWCFKILKYHSEDMLTYAQVFLRNENIKLHNLDVHYLMLDLANIYRYKPESYRGSGFKLYFQTWWCILSNFRFIMIGPKLRKQIPNERFSRP